MIRPGGSAVCPRPERNAASGERVLIRRQGSFVGSIGQGYTAGLSPRRLFENSMAPLRVAESRNTLPRQNRPVVRDGRIQAPPASKKRTERSYLQPQSDPEGATAAKDETVVQEGTPAEMASEASAAGATVLAVDPTAAFAAPPVPDARTTPPAPAPATRSAQPVPARPAGVVRALQQQGVRKRSDVDLDALARRDTSYAVHELRRIAILTIMVVAALVVLTIVLR